MFRNLQASPIQALALVIEYKDQQSRTIDRVPIIASTPEALRSFQLPFAAQTQNQLKAPLPSGGAMSMGGVKDGMATSTCPSRAVVTFAEAQFVDGKTKQVAFSEWSLDAIPRHVPSVSRTSPPPDTDLPAWFLGKISIDEAGNVLDVVSDDQRQPRLLDWARDYMKRDWKFHPALVDGKPVSSTLNALFLFHAKGMLKYPTNGLPCEPVTLIHFLWTHDALAHDDGPDRWTVMYGFLNENSTVN